MSLNNDEKQKVILLVNQAIEKAKDRPELKEELIEITKKLSNSNDYSIHVSSLTPNIEYVNGVIKAMEGIVTKYTKQIDVNDIVGLEEAKKELSINLMYFSSYKDKLMYEVEYLEDVFKKEMFAKKTADISLNEGVSYTQAEKKVNADPEYMELRKQIYGLKSNIQTLKTKYDFFSKMVQVIVQSIS